MLIALSQAAGAAIQCAVDQNGDGQYTLAGETSACLVTSEGDHCPIDNMACDANEVCPIGAAPCLDGSCSVPGLCTDVGVGLECDLDGVVYPDPTTCVTACQTTAACTTEVCPLGPAPCVAGSCSLAGSCADTGAGFQCDVDGVIYADAIGCSSACSATALCTDNGFTCPVGDPCVDVGGVAPVCYRGGCFDDTLVGNQPVETQVPTDMLQNDGTLDANGVCLDQVYIFSGRPMSCRRSGVDTGFSNCCKDTDKVFADSAGSAAELVQTAGLVKNAFNLVRVSVTGYLSGGAAGVQASLTNYAVTFMDPTTIAVSVAVFAVTEFLTQGCSETDTETAMLASSDMCHYIGSFCSKDWPLAGCVQDEESYCCFNSMLGRIIHEQGRSQIAGFGLVEPFGEPEEPVCRGFTPEEFQALDFSQIDMSEYYTELQTQATPLIQQDITDGIQQFYNDL